MIHAEVFTSTDDLEQFLLIENEMIRMLEMQINDYESKLKILKIRHAEYVSKHKEATIDVPGYLGNPVNAFQLTKRITVDWEQLKKQTLPDIFNEDVVFNSMSFNGKPLEPPKKEDLSGAALALARLQDTYNLHPKLLANGIIKNRYYNSSMSASDCYELAVQLSLNKKYQLAAEWYEEALSRHSDKTLTVLKEYILGELALVYSLNDRYVDALKATVKLLEITPLNEIARKNKKVLEESIKDEENEKINKNTSEEEPLLAVSQPLEDRIMIYDASQIEAYKKLCRNELHQTLKQQASLKCKYITNDVPFLKIAPIKVEEASLDPYIVTFHNVLYESEMELIKSVTRPTLERAQVEDFKNNMSVGESVEYRISKASWIEDDEQDFIHVINQRIEDMTRTSLKTAEPLQIVNYGIGGQYEPHFDFALKDDLTFESAGNGNRLATFMFYMSDVIEGGATVFPLINVAVWPQKGSAVFWWNLFASGGLDYRTKHAGCPVLVGSKWVSNKWIHEKGQEFLRPCKLVPDDNNSNVHFIERL